MNLIGVWDFVEWLDRMWGEWLHGPLREFELYRPAALSGERAEGMRQRYHVPVYGRTVGYSRQWQKGQPHDLVGLHVPVSQARWAEYLLLRADMGVVSPLFDKSNAKVKPGPMPPPWTKKGARPRTVSGWMVVMMRNLFG